jgi:hypothetical protein
MRYEKSLFIIICRCILPLLSCFLYGLGWD